MKPIRTLILAVVVMASFPAAAAGPQAQALSSCLSDHTSGKERKSLARWIFLAMAAHPEMKDISAATDEAKRLADEFMGKLVTKLISEDCAKEARAAMDKEGGGAMEFAFGSLGELAMQELMTNPAVNASISAFEKHMDQAKIRAALAPK
jgi:hypothetical protein